MHHTKVEFEYKSVLGRVVVVFYPTAPRDFLVLTGTALLSLSCDSACWPRSISRNPLRSSVCHREYVFHARHRGYDSLTMFVLGNSEDFLVHRSPEQH